MQDKRLYTYPRSDGKQRPFASSQPSRLSQCNLGIALRHKTPHGGLLCSEGATMLGGCSDNFYCQEYISPIIRGW